MSRSRLSDLEQIAIRWYTEQRGRVLGNTRAWHDLSDTERIMILEETNDLLDTMATYAKPEPTPHEMRNHG